MEKKTVVVTGIGGNVGQGILRNLKASGLPLRIIGLNVTPFSPGNHLVDTFYTVPFAYDSSYIPSIISIVKNEKVDLIIPSTDYEVYYLALHAHEIACPLAASGPDAAGTYLDKYLTWERHEKLGIPFASSLLPSAYQGQFSRAIAKPRKGRGSRGIMIDQFDPTLLKDEEYMVQELVEGEEITSAVYRSYLTGSIAGLITMSRSLEHGTTTYTRVVRQYDQTMEKMAGAMCQIPDLRGSFNIQAIVAKDGTIIPFEINCRISGTNSIRSQFGFKDVEYTIRELLYNETISPPTIQDGVAQRILMDVIYPGVASESQLTGTATDQFSIF